MPEFGWTYRSLMVPLIVAAVALYLLPLLRLLALSVLDPAPGLGNYAWVATSSATWKILATTLRISAVAAALAVVLGYVVAYVIWLRPGPLGTALLAGVLVSFWLSVLVRCFTLLMTFGARGPFNTALQGLGIIDAPLALMRSEPGVIIGMVHYLLPYAVLTLLAAVHGIDTNLIGAARSLGARRTTVFRTIVLPLSARGIVAAFSLAFILSLGFYITPAILGGGRVVMIAEFITFHVQDVLAWGKAATLAVLLTASVAVGAALVRLVRRPAAARP